MKVKCTAAPIGYERLGGMYGELHRGAPPSLMSVFVAAEGGEYPIVDSTGWSFESRADDPIIEAARFLPENPTKLSAAEPTPGHRRSREVYDANHFVIDLDQAISYVRSVAQDMFGDSVEAQPHLKPGCSPREAIFEVCFALVVRRVPRAGLLNHLELLANARKLLVAIAEKREREK